MLDIFTIMMIARVLWYISLEVAVRYRHNWERPLRACSKDELLLAAEPQQS